MNAPELINAGVVVLKRWELAWAGALTDAVRESLKELKPFLPWATDGYDEPGAAEFIAQCAREWDEGTGFGYAVFTTTGELIGSIGLMTRLGPGTLEIGYWLRTPYAGRGYMTAAVEAITRVAIAVEPGVRVYIQHDEANQASGAVARKAGFTVDQRIDRDPTAPGETRTLIRQVYRPAPA